MSSLELKIPPDVAAIVIVGGMWAAARFAPSLAVPVPYAGIAAGVLFAAAVALIVAARVALARADTTFSPIAPGRSHALVTSGVFRFSRNPIYLGMLLALLGAAVLFGNAAALVLVVAFVVYLGRFQIAPEERALRLRFGSDYDAYAARVRRWA